MAKRCERIVGMMVHWNTVLAFFCGHKNLFLIWANMKIKCRFPKDFTFNSVESIHCCERGTRGNGFDLLKFKCFHRKLS